MRPEDLPPGWKRPRRTFSPTSSSAKPPSTSQSAVLSTNRFAAFETEADDAEESTPAPTSCMTAKGVTFYPSGHTSMSTSSSTAAGKPSKGGSVAKGSAAGSATATKPYTIDTALRVGAWQRRRPRKASTPSTSSSAVAASDLSSTACYDSEHKDAGTCGAPQRTLSRCPGPKPLDATLEDEHVIHKSVKCALCGAIPSASDSYFHEPKSGEHGDILCQKCIKSSEYEAKYTPNLRWFEFRAGRPVDASRYVFGGSFFGTLGPYADLLLPIPGPSAASSPSEARTKPIDESLTVDQAYDDLLDKGGCIFCEITPIQGQRYQLRADPEIQACNDCYHRLRATGQQDEWCLATAASVVSDTDDIHEGFSCDGCGMLPIVGTRWRSTHLHDYDICHRCYPQVTSDADNADLSGSWYRAPVPRGRDHGDDEDHPP